MKNIITYFMIIASVIALAASAQAKDITKQVIEHTDVDDQVRVFCHQYCQGNHSKGTVNRITIVHAKKHFYKVFADVTLLNRHVMKNGIELFDYGIKGRGHGVMNGKTCHVRVDGIHVLNDPTGVFNKLAKDEVGQIHHVPDCAQFLPDQPQQN
ncbi:MAG: hypothetical protein ACQ9MH_10960 [Nitrospinales bacterium]